MPGILIMNDNVPNGPIGSQDGDNKKRSHDGHLINGDRADGASSKAVSASVALAGIAPSGLTPEKLSELPPEIVHISDEAYHSLSTLMLRVTQQTYNDLKDVLQNMADMPLQPEQPQTNGAFSNGSNPQAANQAHAEAVNRQKKLLLMKFAQENRAKFIKLLVLTEWGKKSASDVKKLVDLMAWAREQQAHIDFVDCQLERIKIFSISAAEKNPDITTALQILSTGTAPWMPTLGYISPEPVSSENALKLLRFMNTSLSIRLNVHEKLPRRLQNWSVQSGRATFIIDKELEFDVVSFVEDVSEQWFFVDLRILSSPAPSVSIGSHFFARIKQQADFILREKGLEGLYDFLHNFMLTHKIAVLRTQAVALARSVWSGSLKVEPVHRELVVSYWTGRPGKKNWIEIGVANNKPKIDRPSWRGPPLPSLSVRWFRQGKIVKDADLKFDWQEVSFEKVIKRVIALHTSDVLQSASAHLNSNVNAQTNLSVTEPTKCSLRVALGPFSNATTLSLEPVTGNYILQPTSAVFARAEAAFNQGREPQQIASILTQALAQTLRELVQQAAQQLGWQAVSKLPLQLEALRATVKLDIIQYIMYLPRGWSDGWSLAAVVDNSGVSWWIIQTSETGGTRAAVDYAEQIKLDKPNGNAMAIDRTTLASLERVAVQLLSTRIITRRLEKEKMAFSLQPEFAQVRESSAGQRTSLGWVLYLQTTDLLSANPSRKPWLEPNLALVCQGLGSDGDSIWHIAAGKMVKDVAADMQKLMATSQQNGFKLSTDGNFKILLCTKFGHDILGTLRAKLRDVNRLRSFATTLQKRRMRLGSSSLQRVQFQYGPSPHVAAVNFSLENEVTIEIPPNNPHYRIRKLLTEIANERTPAFSPTYFNDTNGLDRFCTALVLTRPALTALNDIEQHDGNLNLRNPAVHAHSIFKFRLTYENPVCTFDVCAQAKDDKVYWFIVDNFKQHLLDLRPSEERSPGHRRLESLQVKLKDLFNQHGERWFGTRNGIVAEIDGVFAALKKLNEVVLSCTMEGGYKAPPPAETPATNRQSQPATQSQHQPQQNGIPQNAQQARMAQQARQQQLLQQQQQQAQNQARKQQPPQQQQQGPRGQMPNGRPQQGMPQQQQQQQQLGKLGGRPGQQLSGKQDVIEID